MAETSQAPATATAGQIAAAVFGNALEFYDFTTYAIFAKQIGQTFFPAGADVSGSNAIAYAGQLSHGAGGDFLSILSAVVAFGIGFTARPVGAYVIGRMGDRIGRRSAMMVSFVMMGVGLLGVVLTPSYAAIGWMAPVLLVFFRLVQGFALGGEVGPTTAFLIEAAPPGRRGFVGSWQSGSQGAASLVGAVFAFGLAAILSKAQIADYGWRIVFGFGVLILPFGFWLRRRLPETLHRVDPGAPDDGPAAGASLVAPIVLGLGMIMSFTTSTYVLLFMTTFATETLHLSAAAAFGASVANGFCGLLFAVLGGWLSDRYGRKRVMITARTLFMLATYPLFMLMVQHPSALTVIGGTAIMSAFSSTSVGVALVALTESLPRGIRSSGLALIYAIGAAGFGSIAQPLLVIVLRATGNPMAPAWYLIPAAAVGILAMSFLKETHPDRVRAGAVIETA